jgi:phospholipase C
MYGKFVVFVSMLLLMNLALSIEKSVGGNYADSPIKHIVVLMQENRAFDHIFGWSSNEMNGLKGDEFNLVNLSDASSERIYVNSNCPPINLCDPGLMFDFLIT